MHVAKQILFKQNIQCFINTNSKASKEPLAKTQTIIIISPQKTHEHKHTACCTCLHRTRDERVFMEHTDHNEGEACKHSHHVCLLRLADLRTAHVPKEKE